MRTTTKILITAAASLVLIGSIIFGSVMLMLNWDITKLSTHKYETNEHELSESFSSISVLTDTASIVFFPSDNEKCSVVCYEEEKVKHSVFVKDDTLTVEAVNTKKWYEHIGINIGSPKITVYLPSREYRDLYVKTATGAVEIPKDFAFENIDVAENTGSVKCCASASGNIKIKTTTGSIRVEGVSAAYIDLSVSTGKVTLSDIACTGDVSVNVSTGNAELSSISCKNLTSSGSTGSISLVNVIASEKLSVKRSTGNVKFSRSDASEILVKTDTGSVSGSLLSEKVFITSTDTGRIDVPKTASGGRCEITTDTGNIIISIQE